MQRYPATLRVDRVTFRAPNVDDELGRKISLSILAIG